MAVIGAIIVLIGAVMAGILEIPHAGVGCLVGIALLIGSVLADKESDEIEARESEVGAKTFILLGVIFGLAIWIMLWAHSIIEAGLSGVQ